MEIATFPRSGDISVGPCFVNRYVLFSCAFETLPFGIIIWGIAHTCSTLNFPLHLKATTYCSFPLRFFAGGLSERWAHLKGCELSCELSWIHWELQRSTSVLPTYSAVWCHRSSASTQLLMSAVLWRCGESRLAEFSRYAAGATAGRPSYLLRWFLHFLFCAHSAVYEQEENKLVSDEPQ